MSTGDTPTNGGGGGPMSFPCVPGTYKDNGPWKWTLTPGKDNLKSRRPREGGAVEEREQHSRMWNSTLRN
ncbi:hypothetical protein B9Z55_028010 [Caenorhabditis nigoni]|uniref:Uncharacterized protein n=1 Tax=Caenorhabditis nigoni TaxID=1611254 RepID=A0A2G5SE70_9PELO|nr:hypothetical protein B9Z55_028010 [Caenorhabditis nigoni]